jgi:VWFA-related protein
VRHERSNSSLPARLWLAPLLLGCAVVLGATVERGTVVAQTQKTTPTFPTSVELVTIDAVVLDAEDRPVRGLTRDDFVVREAGRARAIESFEAIALAPGPEAVGPSPEAVPPIVATNVNPPATSGRAFAVLVDDLGISRPETPEVRNAVRMFLERSLVDGDEVILSSTSGGVWWSARIPEGREDLLTVLDRVEGRYVDSTQTEHMTEYEAYWINNHEVSAPNLTTTNDMMLPGSIRERVIRRWLNRSLCGVGTYGAVANCVPMVRASAASIDEVRRQRGRLTLEAVQRAFLALAPMHGRKSLLLFSPGFVEDEELPLAQIRAASRESHTAVYFIDARGLMTDGGLGQADVMDQFGEPGDQTRMRFEQRNLASAGAQGLAADTGGFSVRNTNDLAGGARHIADESRVFYLLGFRASEEGAADEWRKLEVEVTKPGLKVRARRGYTLRPIAPGRTTAPPVKVAKKKKKDEGEAGPTPGVRAALDSVLSLPGIPLQAMVYVLEPRANGSTHVLVAAELDAGQLAFRDAGAQRVADLELGITVTHRDTGRGFLHSKDLAMAVNQGEPLGWRGLAREFELTTGVHQARVVVRDRSTGRMGAITQRFEVPFPEELRLSTPILTDRLVPAQGQQKRPQPALSAHRTFLSSGGLYCQFEVFGAARDSRTGAPKVAAGLEIRTRNGRVIRAVDPTPIEPDADGRLVRMVGMNLDGMEEGAYEFVVSIRDQVKHARLEDRQPFMLVSTLP